MRSSPPAVPYGKYGSPNPSAISARIVLPGFIPLGISCYLSASETGGCRLPDAGPDNSFALLLSAASVSGSGSSRSRAVIVFKKSGQSAEEVFRRFLLSGQRGQIHDRTRNRRDFPTALRDVSAKRSVQRAEVRSVQQRAVEKYPRTCDMRGGPRDFVAADKQLLAFSETASTPSGRSASMIGVAKSRSRTGLSSLSTIKA